MLFRNVRYMLERHASVSSDLKTIRAGHKLALEPITVEATDEEAKRQAEPTEPSEQDVSSPIVYFVEHRCGSPLPHHDQVTITYGLSMSKFPLFGMNS